MSHYSVLGVADGADPAEVRRAYLALARAHHPDLQPAGAERDRAERRMQAVNEAWAVLSDPDARRSYDQHLGLVDADDSVGHRIQRPSTEFVPYFAEDEDDDDSWRFEPDEFDPQTAIGRGLAIAPVAAAALGVVATIVAVMVQIRSMWVVAAVCFAASGLLFVFAPVVAMFKSQLHERR
ncbi:MAG: J domain-containing protein [Actinomycetes bacterium]